LAYAHDVVARIDFSDLRLAEDQLTAINAFEDDTDRRLLMPQPS
jgi:hypothetical protein